MSIIEKTLLSSNRLASIRRSSIYHVHEEIENIRPLYRLFYVLLLQRLPLVILAVIPAPQSHLQYEHLARLREQDRGLGADHPHVLVALHYALDPREGEVVVVLEVLLRLNLVSPERAHLPELAGPEFGEAFVELGEEFGGVRRHDNPPEAVVLGPGDSTGVGVGGGWDDGRPPRRRRRCRSGHRRHGRYRVG